MACGALGECRSCRWFTQMKEMVAEDKNKATAEEEDNGGSNTARGCNIDNTTISKSKTIAEESDPYSNKLPTSSCTLLCLDTIPWSAICHLPSTLQCLHCSPPHLNWLVVVLPICLPPPTSWCLCPLSHLHHYPPFNCWLLCCHLLPSASQLAPLSLITPLHLLIVASASQNDPLVVDCCVALSYSGVHLSSLNFYDPLPPPLSQSLIPTPTKSAQAMYLFWWKINIKEGLEEGRRRSN